MQNKKNASELIDSLDKFGAIYVNDLGVFKRIDENTINWKSKRNALDENLSNDDAKEYLKRLISMGYEVRK